MKSMVALWYSCLSEAGDQCRVQTRRDAEYASQRIRTEGLSFLTIALPAFEKDLLSAIQLGAVTSDHFTGFRRRGGLPAFLSGFLRLMFDTSGKLRPDAPPYVLRAVRQVLLLLSKVELDTTGARRRAAIQQYIDTDAGVESASLDLLMELRSVARVHLNSFFSDVEQRLYRSEWRPRHSSGALATRESYNSRFGFGTWTERLQAVFPWEHDLDLTLRQLIELDVRVLPRDEEPPVRVALVPKTMKTPRVIAMEPVWMMFVQQGIFHAMTDSLTSRRFAHLNGAFGWLDQQPNREAAREGSLSGELATLDLSEASDRVSLSLVEAVFGDHKFLLRAMMACRSERSVLPDGRVISLRKFASMGSALCFPVESVVFYAIVRAAERRLGLRGTPVRVYGDDLVVDTRIAQTVIQLLEAMGLKVNTRKSFTTGNFRESCGSDWFKGGNVEVVKLRHPLPESQRQVDLIRSGVEFHNRLYESGWFSTADHVRRLMRPVVRRPLYIEPGSIGHAFYSWERSPEMRWNPDLHRFEVRTYLFREAKPNNAADGEAALRKSLSPHYERDLDHLERDGRSLCVGMNIGWTEAR